MARNLMHLLQNPGERQPRGDAFREEAFRATLEGVAPIFREQSIRAAVPTTVLNDPGVLISRHLAATDVAAAEAGMRGTGGTYDRADHTVVDIQALAIWKNIEARWRDLKTSSRAGFDLWQQSVQAATERVVQKENTYIVDGLGSNKGITNATGIQTFASAGAWTTAGIAFQDIAKAVYGKLANVQAPWQQAALLVNPADYANLQGTVLSNTDTTSITKVNGLLPGGIYPATDVDVGKAYVYARTPTVLEYRVYEDLSVIDLPQTDEDERLRVRVIGALHVKKPTGIVEITSIDT
jgi:uncharacterized linocin/CFP29 family protein